MPLGEDHLLDKATIMEHKDMDRGFNKPKNDCKPDSDPYQSFGDMGRMYPFAHHLRRPQPEVLKTPRDLWSVYSFISARRSRTDCADFSRASCSSGVRRI